MTLPLFPSDLAVTVDDTVYAISGWSSTALLTGTVAVLALVVTLFILCRRPDRLHPVLWIAVAAGMLAAAATVLAVSPGEYGPRHAVTLFRPLFFGATVASAAGVGAGFAAFIAMAVSGPRPLVVAFGVVTMAASVGLVAAARQHTQALVAFGDLPFFVAKGRDDLHVGRDRDVPVELDYLAPPSGFWIFAKAGGPRPIEPAASSLWSPPPSVHVHAEKEGRFPVTVSARRGPVELTTTLRFRGRREAASPLLPLRVGNRWVYRVVTKQDTGHVLYVNRVGGEEHEGPRFELEVTRADEHDGFRTFIIEARGGATTEVTRVIALEGQTLFVRDESSEGGPVIETTASLPTVAPVDCSVPFLGMKRATCQLGGAEADELPKRPPPKKPAPARRGKKPEPAPVPVRFALAGPLTFRTHKSDIGGTIGTGILAVATLGILALPDGSSDTTYALVETHPGPEGAPAAP